MGKNFFGEKFRLRKENLKNRILLVILAILMCLQAGCGGGQGSREDFSAYMNQIFRAEVTASTLNMHYNLAHPEQYGIQDYKVTYGKISAREENETSVILENWKENLKKFNKKDLTVSQQMTYDIMMDYIEKEIPAGKFYLHEEILRPSTGFQSQDRKSVV